MPIGQKRCQTDTEAVFKKPSKKWVLSTAENRACSRSAAEFEKQMLLEQNRVRCSGTSEIASGPAPDGNFPHSHLAISIFNLSPDDTSGQRVGVTRCLAPDPEYPCVLSGLK